MLSGNGSWRQIHFLIVSLASSNLTGGLAWQPTQQTWNKICNNKMHHQECDSDAVEAGLLMTIAIVSFLTGEG